LKSAGGYVLNKLTTLEINLSMKAINLSLSTARKIFLSSQWLSSKPIIAYGKEGIAETIEKLGYIQIDTISVIKRSHHHTLWTRHGDYQEKMLHELQAKDRRIFEYWGHAMAYLPMSDYRFYLPRMRNFQNPTSPWTKNQSEKCRHILKPILEQIRTEGPLSSKDFIHHGKKGSTWWDWKPAKAALELLFWRGDLMIAERRNFQKVYDLTERVLPASIDLTLPNEEELGNFFVRRALNALAVASEGEIQKFLQSGAARDSDLQIAGKKVISASLKNLVESKEVILVQLEPFKNGKYFSLSKTLDTIPAKQLDARRVFILSPFDNLIIQRDRIIRLFGFDYTLECYLPPAKRKYGYFVLPILWGEKFVGRLDAKADRKLKAFQVVNLVFEPEFISFEEFLPLFVDKLVNLARFNCCEKVVLEKITPEKIRKNVNKLLGRSE